MPDEVRGNLNADVDEAWIARFELPFAVDGHLHEIRRRHAPHRTGGNVGCLLMALPFAAAVATFAGRKLQQPWAEVRGDQSAQGAPVGLQSLAARLLPGLTDAVTRVPYAGYHPSLLTPRDSSSSHAGRIEGNLLGAPIRSDEQGLDFDHSRPARWMPEVDLPPGAIPPGVLRTDGLFAVLRDRPDIWIAATARTLSIFVQRSISAFDPQVPTFDNANGRKRAALAMQDVEAVTREVLAAAGISPAR